MVRVLTLLLSIHSNTPYTQLLSNTDWVRTLWHLLYSNYTQLLSIYNHYQLQFKLCPYYTLSVLIHSTTAHSTNLPFQNGVTTLTCLPLILYNPCLMVSNSSFKNSVTLPFILPTTHHVQSGSLLSVIYLNTPAIFHSKPWSLVYTLPDLHYNNSDSSNFDFQVHDVCDVTWCDPTPRVRVCDKSQSEHPQTLISNWHGSTNLGGLSIPLGSF